MESGPKEDLQDNTHEPSSVKTRPKALVSGSGEEENLPGGL